MINNDIMRRCEVCKKGSKKFWLVLINSNKQELVCNDCYWEHFADRDKIPIFKTSKAIKKVRDKYRSKYV